jgi:hypothetical protein
MLTENPTSQTAATVPISATGIAITGISVARASRRKTKITAVTISTLSPRANSTSWMAPLMKSALSEVMNICTSSGKQRLQLGHHLPDGGRNRQRVAVGLPDDADADAGLSVRPQDGRAGFRPQGHLRHVAQPHVARHRQRLDLRGGADGGGGAHHQALPIRRQRARRRVKGRIAQGRAQVGQRQAARRQLHQVHIHAEHQPAVAVDLQVGHPLGRQEPRLGQVSDQLGQVLGRPAGRGDGDPQHRVAIGIGLDHARRLGRVRQGAAGARHRIAQVGRRHVQVDIVAKLHRHPAGPEPGRGRDRLDPRHPARRALDHRRHLAVDGFRRRPRIGGRDGDDRPVDIGQFAHVDAKESRQPRDHDQRVQHKGQDRPPDEQRGAVAALDLRDVVARRHQLRGPG